MASRIGRSVSALALPLLAAPALAQDFNDLEINNGGDIIFIYSDPSVGAPLGTNPPDFDGDYWWKVFPRTIMNHPVGSMELTGLTIELYDTDWVATPADSSFDGWLGAAVNSPVNPGNLEPDFSDPNGFLGGVASFGGALTNPCPALGPSACSGACPLPGFVVGYVIGLSVTDPITGAGVAIQADGTVDWAWTTFVAGGQTYTAGTGSCGNGDGILQDVHSTNAGGGSAGELQSDILGTGYSAYGGFHIGLQGVGNNIPDGLDEVYAAPLEFGGVNGATIEGRVDLGLGPQRGTAALNPSASGQLGMRLWAQSAIGELGFFFGSFFPLLPAPGIPIFDINIMINVADPVATTISQIWNGPIVQGGTFNDDGILDTAMVTVPPAAIGFTLNLQGFNFDPVSLDFDNSQVASLPIQP